MVPACEGIALAEALSGYARKARICYIAKERMSDHGEIERSALMGDVRLSPD